jgi:hypothetical protein
MIYPIAATPLYQLLQLDISRLGSERTRRNSETCEAVSETSGWSPVAITKPRGLSKKRFKYEDVKNNKKSKKAISNQTNHKILFLLHLHSKIKISWLYQVF